MELIVAHFGKFLLFFIWTCCTVVAILRKETSLLVLPSLATLAWFIFHCIHH